MTGRKLIAILRAFAVAVFAAPAASPLHAESAADPVVRITCKQADGKYRYGAGTGFLFPTNREVVTALHVAIGCVDILIHSATFREEARGTPKLMRRESDLLLLELDRAISLPAARIYAIEPNPTPGASVIAVGYPLGIDKLDSTDAQLRRIEALTPLEGIATTEAKAQLRRLGFPDLALPVLNLQGPLTFGHSGAPVLDARSRKLIGIVSGGLEGGNIDRAWAISAKTLLDFNDWQTAAVPVPAPSAAQALRALYFSRPAAPRTAEELAKFTATRASFPIPDATFTANFRLPFARSPLKDYALQLESRLAQFLEANPGYDNQAPDQVFFAQYSREGGKLRPGTAELRVGSPYFPCRGRPFDAACALTRTMSVAVHIYRNWIDPEAFARVETRDQIPADLVMHMAPDAKKHVVGYNYGRRTGYLAGYQMEVRRAHMTTKGAIGNLFDLAGAQIVVSVVLGNDGGPQYGLKDALRALRAEIDLDYLYFGLGNFRFSINDRHVRRYLDTEGNVYFVFYLEDDETKLFDFDRNKPEYRPGYDPCVVVRPGGRC